MPIRTSMARVFGLPLILVTVVVAGFLTVRQMQSNGPTSSAVTQIVTQAGANVAGANFAGAAPALQAWYTENGTYAGASLPPGTGVTLVRADASGYCLQADVGGAQQHEVGPQGQPLPGPC